MANFDAPIVIKKGGVYTGNWRSDSNAPAVTIECYEPVTIIESTIESKGKMVHVSGGAKLTILRSTLRGLVPDGNEQRGRAVDIYHPQYFVFENNIVEGTGGIRVDHMDENTKNVYIRYNKFLNTDKRRVDGSEGDHRASILFDGVVGIDGEIAWNYFENKPNESWVEDNINLRNSGGKKDNWFKIHDNYIKGAYPAPLSYNQDRGSNYTGSGITVEGDPGTTAYDKVAQYVHVYNNQVISTMNGGINVNHGHDHLVENNTIVSSGQVNGIYYTTFWGGMSSWNGSKLDSSVYNNIVFKNNTVGYYRKGVFVGGIDRQDVVVEIKPENTQNVDPKLQIPLPNPITQATEDAEYSKWVNKLSANSIVVGIGQNVVTTTTTTNYPKFKIGDVLNGSISVFDEFEAASTYQAGSLKITGDDLVKVTQDSKDETKFTVEILKEGTSIITVTLTTNNNNTLTEKANVTSEAIKLQEAKRIVITITK